MKPFQTLETQPDGEETLLDTKLADGGMGSIIQIPSWTPQALICWGGLRLGGKVTVHLVKALEPYGASLGGLTACSPSWGPNVTWTFEFGFTEWEGAVLCKNCFEPPLDAHYHHVPKMKRMPAGGWFTYGVKPKIEKKRNKKAAAVEALLNIPPPRSLTHGAIGQGTKRIVEF